MYPETKDPQAKPSNTKPWHEKPLLDGWDGSPGDSPNKISDKEDEEEMEYASVHQKPRTSASLPKGYTDECYRLQHQQAFPMNTPDEQTRETDPIPQSQTQCHSRPSWVTSHHRLPLPFQGYGNKDNKQKHHKQCGNAVRGRILPLLAPKEAERKVNVTVSLLHPECIIKIEPVSSTWDYSGNLNCHADRHPSPPKCIIQQ
ncbi:hypothetical protein STEG23_029765 [Scotinomys teguina]